MKKLFDKNQVTFAIIWIVIYVVGFSLTDGISADIGFPYLITAIFAAVLLAVLLLFAKKNGLMEYLGLCGFKGSAAKYLFFIPLLLIPAVNLRTGLCIENNVFESVSNAAAKGFAGIVEEIIFRGLLFTGMLKSGNLKSSILISSLTFGIGHIVNLLNGAPVFETVCQIVYACALGFCFTMVFYTSKSLIPCIIPHFLINALSAFRAMPENYQTHVIITCVFLTVVGIGYGAYLLKINKANT